MTSTKFNIGFGEDIKSSSRVLRPPGGGHTNIFGDEAPEPIKTGRRMHTERPGGFTIGDQSEKTAEPPKESPKTEEPVTETSTSNGEAKPDDVKPKEEEKPAPAAAQKKRVPPGGFSSGLW